MLFSRFLRALNRAFFPRFSDRSVLLLQYISGKKKQKKPKVFTFLFEMIAEARPSLSHLAAQPPRSYSQLCCLAAFGLILSAVIDLSAKASGMDSWPGSHCSASGTLLETDGLLGHVHDGSRGHGCFLVRFGYHDTVKLNLRSFLVHAVKQRVL